MASSLQGSSSRSPYIYNSLLHHGRKLGIRHLPAHELPATAVVTIPPLRWPSEVCQSSQLGGLFASDALLTRFTCPSCRSIAHVAQSAATHQKYGTNSIVSSLPRLRSCDRDLLSLSHSYSLRMLLRSFHCGAGAFLLILLCVASIPAPSRSALPDSNQASVVFTPPLRSISTAVLDVKLRPTFLTGTLMNSPASIQIRLSGAGISCAVNSSVVFLLPFGGMRNVCWSCFSRH